MTEQFTLVIICGLVALLYGVVASKSIISADAGNEKMREIASAIQEGAAAYLNRQYITISVVGIVVTIILAITLGFAVAIGFVIGAVLSGIAGYVGMNVSVRANVRTAQSATVGLEPALNIAFKSGAVTGMLVVGLGLLGVAGYYLILLEMFDAKTTEGLRHILEALVALSFGASLISIFARLGGGIFTKGADVGGDMVGKVEAGIPEDDPRNAASIADNVGDNVGDCAGMAADLFETYAVTVVATMLLAAIFFSGEALSVMMMYPLVICGVCIIASVVGTWFVRLGQNKNIMWALYKGFISSAVISAVLIGIATWHMLGFSTGFTLSNGLETSGRELFYCALVGLIVTGLLVWITEYYTSTEYRPVRTVAKSSETGDGTNVIQGLAISMEACAIPAIIISAGILASFIWGGIWEANKRGAKTALLCFNPTLKIPRDNKPNTVINPKIGPELLTGSTRLKSGTATKLILNIITTLAMVQIGKVVGNLMVDLDPSNTKLRARAVRIVRQLTQADEPLAREALEQSNWVVKKAIARLAKR